jgi:arylsulfatase A-like enzyme
LIDYKAVDYCIERLQKKFDKPLLLACGFNKPHMPWEVPRKYFDMYPLNKIELPKVQPNLDGLPAVGKKFAHRANDHANIIKSGRWKEAVQAYLATITYMDTQLGRLLDAFEKSAYKDNTVIVLWSDHGWHLGEKEHWRKFALWEESTRSPLIWVVPGLTKPGGVCERAVDFMHIYPTLCDLAGLPIPAHIEGASIRPLLENPKAAWERPAIITYQRNNHAIRSDKWRYIRYADGGEELYDHDNDPLEWKNLANDSKYESVKDAHRKWLPKVNVPTPPKDIKMPVRSTAVKHQGGEPPRFSDDLN